MAKKKPAPTKVESMRDKDKRKEEKGAGVFSTHNRLWERLPTRFSGPQPAHHIRQPPRVTGSIPRRSWGG